MTSPQPEITHSSDTTRSIARRLGPWWWVVIAIICEIAATSTLPATDGFTDLLPTVAVLFGYALSLFSLSQALVQLEVGIVYAIWSGVGTAVVALIGMLHFDEVATPTKVVALALIIVGVVLINLDETQRDTTLENNPT